LRDQIAAAIGRGELAPGARLPTMREVAVTLAVDLNTVQRAYAALEEDGLVTMVQGRGSFVADAPRPAGNREADIKLLAAKVAAQAQAAGVSADELTEALRELARRGP
jgi:GntR family transcriptional regulator